LESVNNNKNQMPLKVLHIVGRLNYGGIETIIRDFAKRLPRDRIMQTICCILPGEGALTEEVRRAGVVVHVIPYNSRRIISFLRNLSAFIRNEGIDVVHSHIFFSTVWIALASKLGGVKGFVSTIHSIYSLSLTKCIEFRILNMIANQFISKNVCISSSVLNNSLKNFGLRKSTFEVIHNGIDTTVFTGDYEFKNIYTEIGVPSDAIIVGTVGSLREIKNQSMLLKSLSQAIQKGMNVCGIIVGEGSLRKKLEDEAKSLNIDDKIFFTGARNDVPEILSGLDIFVLTSIYEGVGNVILEAMSSKLPVIVTNFQAAFELINNNIDGYIVPVNDVNALAQKIEYLYYNSEERESIGRTARKKAVENFDATKMLAGYERLYYEIAGRTQ